MWSSDDKELRMKNNNITSAEIEAALQMVQATLDSLNISNNNKDLYEYSNIFTAILHVLTAYKYCAKRIPVDIEVLAQCAAFVSPLASDATLPEDVSCNFRTIQSVLYLCCGYSKVKFNGR